MVTTELIQKTTSLGIEIGLIAIIVLIVLTTLYGIILFSQLLRDNFRK